MNGIIKRLAFSTFAVKNASWLFTTRRLLFSEAALKIDRFRKERNAFSSKRFQEIGKRLVKHDIILLNTFD